MSYQNFWHGRGGHTFCQERRENRPGSLLLAAGAALLLALARDDLAKHHNAVAVHERHARQALAVLEGVAHERLLRLEAALSHLVGLEGVGILHLLATRLLAHLPLQLADAARRAPAAHEADRGVADLDLVGDVEHLDLRVELLRLTQGGVLLVDHHVARAGHVVLVEALDVEANVVPRVGKVDALVVHLHGEHLASARVRSGVRGQEHDLLARLHHALLHAPSEHIADTLDLVDARDRHAHWRAGGPLWHAAHHVKHIVDGVHVDGLLAVLDIAALPPAHVVRLFQKVVAHPARDGHHRRPLLDEVLLPSNLDQHALHLVGDLVVAGLLVPGGVAVHLVDANADLLHAQQVDQAGVLASLPLDLASLVVALGDGGREITVGRDHDKRNVRLGSAGDHVLDEIAMAWGIDDGVVPLLGVELLGGASDGHAALALLLLAVHVEREGEGALAQALGLRLQLLELTLGQSAQLEDQAASGGALATVDVAADHDGQVLLLRVGRHGCPAQLQPRRPAMSLPCGDA
mmetsp:Transcript_14645/g.39179  ORF Transcript_14645/g.39179 Transcript_14645/m.39179 type:complete len:521 (+) Transcript_14645:50-1612(+)